MLLDLKKVFLQDDETLVIEREMDMSAYELNGEKPFITPIKVNAKIFNKAGIIRLKADVNFDFCCPCDRCMANVNKAYSYSFNHVLVNTNDNNPDDDYVCVSEYKLDLDALIMEDIILELPRKTLCKQDCKGICPKCGKNLNEGTCDCVAYQIDPRLEVLKNLID